MNTATIAKVLQIEYDAVGVACTVAFLTDKGIIVKHYEFDERFFNEYEAGKVEYKRLEEFI